MKLSFFSGYLLFLIISINVGYGQLFVPATPPSFSAPLLKSEIAPLQLKSVNAHKLITEDRAFDTIKSMPWRFGENIETHINLNNSGNWETLPDGGRLWRTSVSSPGAYSLNLTFDQYHLPPGAMLFVYNKDRSMILGAFNEFNNQEDGYFATQLIKGDFITIEYFEPEDVPFEGRLNISMITHSYRDPYAYVKSFSDSDVCNINVSCEQADQWHNPKKSVVMLLTGGNAFCSGTIINNSDFDEKPLVLTANHCFRTPSTIVAWFNWESETCINPLEEPPYQSMSGAISRARDSETDFWLLELMQPIPSEFDVYFAGWNRAQENQLDGGIVGIHHPRGDIKKFSYAKMTQTSTYGGLPGSGNLYWHVTWDLGTTEPGSSGSPLFDNQGRVIGQLRGGLAACGNVLPDYYGNLAVSWNGGGSSERRLRDWLDPSASGNRSLDGYLPSSQRIAKPLEVNALVLDTDKIKLYWKQNSDSYPVMIAVNTNSQFGELSGKYSVGDTIAGGGTIIYMGTDTSFIHRNLLTDIDYFYKIWSYSDTYEYSISVNLVANTICTIFSTLPLYEGFSTMQFPKCWDQEFVVGTTTWETGVGNENNYPYVSYEGSYNIYFRASLLTDYGNSTRLISPQIDVSLYDKIELSFYYANPEDNFRQDVLKVYYKTQDDWILLETFDYPQAVWEEVKIAVPTDSDELMLAFEATSHGGQGISLDKIEVYEVKEQYAAIPVNLQYEMLEDNFLHLSWDISHRGKSGALNQNIKGYNVYKNKDLIYQEKNNIITHFQEQLILEGIYEYYITIEFEDETQSAKSNKVKIEIEETFRPELVINMQGFGVVNPHVGIHSLEYNQEINLVAVADPSWEFVKWEINGQAFMQNEITVQITKNSFANAIFNELSLTEGNSPLKNFNVYPNPATNQINVHLPMGYHWNLKIISLSGEIIYHFKHPFKSDLMHVIDVSTFERGIYLIQAYDQEKNFHTKVVVN
jgi:hypothetical protein